MPCASASRWTCGCTALAKRRICLLLMVSRHGHCLNDLLFRSQSGQLRAEVAAIVSNHPRLRGARGRLLASLPPSAVAPGATPEAKRAQEPAGRAADRRLEDRPRRACARYMQILPGRVLRLPARPGDQHPPQLPAELQGRQAYYQAHDRGVKLIGATAHYVTAELDEGPIIEQDVARVDHRSLSPEDFTAVRARRVRRPRARGALASSTGC